MYILMTHENDTLYDQKNAKIISEINEYDLF
jgi:hypothetical protein